MDKKYQTPLQHDKPHLEDEVKQRIIAEKFYDIMDTLGLDMTDDSLKKTPERVAKMYVMEMFKGLHLDQEPTTSVFENKFNYKNILIEKDITVYSTCEHHFLPIIGKAHVAYVSKSHVIGLSKINRIVDYYAKRPQIQERLTIQIVKSLQDILQTEDVACVVDADHLCVAARGIRDTNSRTLTAHYEGVFKTDQNLRNEFLTYLKNS